LLRRVQGQSMFPTLRSGQLVVAIRYCPKNLANQVVIVNYGDREIIKRVKWFNNQKMFLIGDNPQFSQDSRLFGALDRDLFLGHVIWPRI